MICNEVPLGDLLTPRRHTEDVKLDRAYRIAGIYSFGKGMLDRGSRLGSDMAYRLLTRLSAGQVAFARLNAWEGALAIVPASFDSAYVSNEYPTFDVHTEIVDAAYLRYLLKWSGLWDRLAPRGSMVRRKRTTESVFLATRVPLPGIEEQCRIVAKLETAFTVLSEVMERRDIIQSALTPSMLKSSFALDFPMRPAGEVLRLERDPVDVDPLRDYRYIGMRSFGNGLIHYPATPGSRLSKLRYFSFPAGAVVLSNIKAWEGAVAVTSQAEQEYIASNRFLFYVPRRDNEMDSRFVVYYLLSVAGLFELGRASPGSADRNRTLSITSFERISIPVPPLKAQSEIADMLDRIRVDLEQLVSRRKRLEEALRPALLNAAFSGQL